MFGLTENLFWVRLVNLDPDPSMEGEMASEVKVNNGNIIPASFFTSANIVFSPHGKYLLFAAIDGQGKLYLVVFNPISGDEVYGPVQTLLEGSPSGKSVAGWGFSPDIKDATFVHSYLTGLNQFQLSVVNLTKNPAEYVVSNPNSFTEQEYWRFSPCGDKFVRVYRNSLGHLEGQLYSTDAYNDFAGFDADNYQYFKSAADGHFMYDLSGSPHPISDNTSDKPCPDVTSPKWENALLDTGKVEGVKMVLHWSGATDASGVTAYRIYKDDELWKEIDAVTKCTVTDLTPATQYKFRIEAGDETGNWSTGGPEKVFSTLTDNEPTWPSNELTYENKTETKITLNWEEAVDDFGIEFYKIFIDNIAVDSIGGDTLHYHLKNLKAGTNYQFFVKAVDAAGQSKSSNVLSQTMEPAVDPGWPAGAVLTTSDQTETTLTLNWPEATDNCNAVAGYKICKDGDTIAYNKSYLRSYNVKDLEEGKVYSFAVVAVDESGAESVPLTGELSTLPGYSEFPLVVAPGDQKRPDLSDKLVVWWDDSKDEGDIYAYNLEKDTIIQITKEPHAQFDPAVSGERIVWTDARNGNWDIYMYDPLLGEKAVCTAPGNQDLPAIDGDYIVWRDSRNGEFDIYMYDIVSGKESPVSTHSGLQNWPDISGRYIVYADNRNGNWDIFMYSIYDKKETSICTDPADQTYPVITGTYLSNIGIAYMDNRNGENIYIYYPYFIGDQDYEYLVPLDKYPFISGQYYPHLADKQLVYQDKLGGNGTDFNIYAYQMRYETVGTRKEICVDPVVSANQTRPRTAKGNIVWQDERNGNSDIYIWRRPPGTDLQISLRELTDPVVAGDTLKYILTVTNEGPGINTSITAECTLPVMAKYIRATADTGVITSVGKTIKWEIDTLRTGAKTDLEIVLLTFDLAILEFKASVTSSAFDPDPSNNEISATTKVKNFVPGYLGEGYFPSLQVEQDGRAHIIYFGSDSSLMYATRTRKGKWEYKKLESLIGGIENDMLIDAAGNIQVVMSDGRANAIQVCRLYHGTLTKAGQWSKKIIAVSNIGFHSISLKADSHNELHLIYQEARGSASGGPFFEMSTAAGTWSDPVLFSGGYDHVDMDIDKNDNQHISFYDIGLGLGYQKKTSGTGWSEPVAVEQGWRGAQLEGMVTSIFNDGLGNPHISYVGQVNHDSRENIKYAWNSGSRWNISMVDQGDFQSAGNKIIIDPDGKANFSYIHKPYTSAKDVRYATNIAGPWIKQIIDDKDVGFMVDMGRDQDKYTHVAYPGFNGSLYYALLPQIEYFEIDPDTLDFGLLEAGSEKTLALKLTNPLSKDIRIDSIILHDGRISFDKTSFILSRFATDSVMVTLKQTSDPWINNNLRIWYNVPSGLFMDIPVLAKNRQPQLTIDQVEPIFFGAIPSGTSQTKTVKLTNTGYADLIFSSIIVQGYVIFGQAKPTDFSLVGHNCTTLHPGETCDVNIIFQAGLTNYQSSFLKITSNDPSTPYKQITVYGEIAYPQISYRGGDIGFCPSGQSVTKPVTIGNAGHQNLNITGASVSGPDAALFSLANPCLEIIPGDSCKMQVTLTPDRVGDFQATLTVTSNSRYNNPLSIPLTGSSAVKTLELSTGNISFGSIHVGEKAEVLLELRNNGSIDLKITGIETGGRDKYEFTQNHGCSTIAAGATCIDTVRFIPSFEGDKNATLAVSSNDSYNPVQTVALTGHAGETVPLQVSMSAAPGMGQEPLNVGFEAVVSGGQPPYAYLWEFDDLKSSTEQSPVHTFTGPGIYRVSLTLTDIDNQILTSTLKVAITETGKPGILEGKIWDETGANPILRSNTILYPQSDINDTTLSILTQENSFMLVSLADAKYTVLAIPDPVAYPEDLPTYLGDNILMYNALWIQVTAPVAGKDIRLIKKPAVTSGSGIISGNIVTGAGKGVTVIEKEGTAKGDPLSMVYVFLQSVSDSKIKAYDISGSDGSFSFEGLENGSYYFLADYMGKPMDAANTHLVISDSRKDIEILATVGTEKISVKDLVTGINDAMINKVKVYPVPADDHIIVLIPAGLFPGNSVRVRLLDLSGKNVYITENHDLSGNPLTLDISYLDEGFYLLELADDKIRYNVKILKIK